MNQEGNNFICRSNPLVLRIQKRQGIKTRSMNKFLPIFCLYFLGYGFAFGQLSFGLRGGYCGSLSSQELVNGMERKIGLGATYGFLIQYDLDLHFSLATEANYITYEEILTYSKDFYPPTVPGEVAKAVTTKSLVNYLQIPVLGRATFGEKKFKWFIDFGPYVGIGLSGKRENAMKFNKRLEDSYDAKFQAGDFMSYDLGGQVGAGFQYTLGTAGFLFVQGRFQIGFFDFYNKLTEDQRGAYLGSNAQGYGYFPPGAAWRAVNISAGYFYTIKLPKKNASSGGVKKAGKQGKRK